MPAEIRIPMMVFRKKLKNGNLPSVHVEFVRFCTKSRFCLIKI